MDNQKYPKRFCIDFPESDKALEAAEQLKVPKVYEIAKDIINSGGYVSVKTVYIDGSADEMKIDKMGELRDLFGKV